MSFPMTPEEREERLRELKGFRDAWQKDVEAAADELQRLATLKAALGPNSGNAETLQKAMDRKLKACDELALARDNINLTIARVERGEN